MTQLIGHRISPVTIALTFDDGPKIISNDHPAFTEIRDKLLAKDYNGLYDMCTPKRKIESYLAGSVSIIDGDRFVLDGEEINHAVVPIILNMSKEGADPSTLIAFLRALMQNPSFNSRAQLWAFVERNGITLFEGEAGDVDRTGWLVLYKGVREDLTDCHTGRFDNTPGNTLSMERRKVDDDPNKGCSYGFHAGAYSYVSSFGSRKLIVLVNPADVVSVPHDCSFTKLRTTSYYVLREVERTKFAPIEAAVFFNETRYRVKYEAKWTVLGFAMDEDDELHTVQASRIISAADAEEAIETLRDEVTNEIEADDGFDVQISIISVMGE